MQELENKKILLVHNTFAKKEDLTEHYYGTCPKANLYIENALPDYSIFDTDKLCVGTDSLASNNSLSILEELLVVQENSNFDMNILLSLYRWPDYCDTLHTKIKCCLYWYIRAANNYRLYYTHIRLYTSDT